MITKKLLFNNIITTVTACIIGYMSWFFIAQYQTKTITTALPICFYQSNNKNHTIDGPDTINITVQGKRHELNKFHIYDKAIQLDSSKYATGTHIISLSKENLFLPDSIKLVQLEPSYITITINQK